MCVFGPYSICMYKNTHELKLQGEVISLGVLQLSQQQASVCWGIGVSEQRNSYWGVRVL